MKIYKLYELRRYYARVSSLAFVFDSFVILTITIVPWIISYITGYMYFDSYAFPEKPTILFNGDLLLFLQMSDGFLYYTNINHDGTNRLMKSSLRLPRISFYNSKNRNLKEEDALNIVVEFPISSSEKVISLTAVLLVDMISWRFYNRQNRVPIIINKSFRTPPNAFLYSGDLLCIRKYLTNSKQAGIYYKTETTSKEIFDFYSNISMGGYFLLEDRVSVPMMRQSHSGTFNIELSVHFSSLRTSVNPGFWYTIKFAWVQYLSIGLVLFYLAEKMRGYVYDKQIVRTVVQSTIPKSLNQ
ncbi:unnamed protein product [Schistosoma turkestanicum]|nr:unnamed protein product [Schistosoma turkestanicum]